MCKVYNHVHCTLYMRVASGDPHNSKVIYCVLLALDEDLIITAHNRTYFCHALLRKARYSRHFGIRPSVRPSMCSLQRYWWGVWFEPIVSIWLWQPNVKPHSLIHTCQTISFNTVILKKIYHLCFFVSLAMYMLWPPIWTAAMRPVKWWLQHTVVWKNEEDT